jgi:hypothetical protein
MKVRLILRVVQVHANRERLLAACRRDQVTIPLRATLLEVARAM